MECDCTRRSVDRTTGERVDAKTGEITPAPEGSPERNPFIDEKLARDRCAVHVGATISHPYFVRAQINTVGLFMRFQIGV
jgi:hypothetical protein